MTQSTPHTVTRRALRPRTLPALLWGAWLLTMIALPVNRAVAEQPFRGELDLVLREVLVPETDQTDQRVHLWLYARSDGEQWDRVWGKAQRFSVGDHFGLVTQAEQVDEDEGGGLRLEVEMLIQGDFWRKGKWPATLELIVHPQEDGTVTGTYRGVFRGVKIEGPVEGREHDLREAAAGEGMPEPGERPRLLFREHDLPALREKLKTPFGQAYRERAEASGDPINLGVLYQLTGEQKYADQAREAIDAAYGDKKDGIPVFGFGSGGFGHDMFKVAVAYDLCVEAWPEDFVKWVRPQLEKFAERHQFILMTSHANFHPASNYYGPGRGVPGVVAMALWGETGDAPQPPRDPVARAWPLKPLEDWKPGPGVEANQLTLGQSPTGWVWSGKLPQEVSRDPLNAIGGFAEARPEKGTQTEYLVRSDEWFKEERLQFETVPDDAVDGEGIDLKALDLAGESAAAVFFTAFRADEEQVVRVDDLPEQTKLWVSGVEIDSETVYRLQPGTHSMTVEVRGETLPERLHPTFRAIDADATTGPIALYRIEKTLYDYEQAIHERTGMAAERDFWLHRTWWQNMQHYRLGIGDGGFKAETGGYGNISSWYPSVYASMHRNFFGRPASPYPDVSHIMPRQIMQAVFPEGGNKPRILKLNSALSLDQQWMAAHYPIIPEQYQPAAHWVWNYLAGLRGDGDPAALFSDGEGKSTRQAPSDITLAQTFVNYPLDDQPRHPGTVMPNHWRADTFGFYVHRSGWEGADDAVAQTFLRANPVGGWNHPNAGGFTLQALGHAWMTAPDSRNGARENYSVVLLPDDEINKSGNGRLSHFHAEPNGSGTLTIDMDEVYAKPDGRPRGPMFVHDPDRLVPSGITGLRAFGFDDSGKSGSPVLMAMVDRIEGGGEKVWTWHRAGGEVAIQDNRFTITRGDANLTATFIAPKDVDLTHEKERVEIGEARTGYHGTLDRIKATGDDDFFVIITIQRGNAPTVTHTDHTLDATVTVGEQSIRFDGDKLIFGR